VLTNGNLLAFDVPANSHITSTGIAKLWKNGMVTDLTNV
jgi:hypothetical protein